MDVSKPLAVFIFGACTGIIITFLLYGTCGTC